MNSDLFRPDFVDHYTSWSLLVAVEPQDTGSPSQTTGIPLIVIHGDLPPVAPHKLLLAMSASGTQQTNT